MPAGQRIERPGYDANPGMFGLQRTEQSTGGQIISAVKRFREIQSGKIAPEKGQTKRDALLASARTFVETSTSARAILSETRQDEQSATFKTAIEDATLTAAELFAREIQPKGKNVDSTVAGLIYEKGQFTVDARVSEKIGGARAMALDIVRGPITITDDHTITPDASAYRKIDKASTVFEPYAAISMIRIDVGIAESADGARIDSKPVIKVAGEPLTGHMTDAIEAAWQEKRMKLGLYQGEYATDRGARNGNKQRVLLIKTGQNASQVDIDRAAIAAAEHHVAGDVHFVSVAGDQAQSLFPAKANGWRIAGITEHWQIGTRKLELQADVANATKIVAIPAGADRQMFDQLIDANQEVVLRGLLGIGEHEAFTMPLLAEVGTPLAQVANASWGEAQRTTAQAALRRQNEIVAVIRESRPSREALVTHEPALIAAALTGLSPKDAEASLKTIEAQLKAQRNNQDSAAFRPAAVELIDQALTTGPNVSNADQLREALAYRLVQPDFLEITGQMKAASELIAQKVLRESGRGFTFDRQTMEAQLKGFTYLVRAANPKITEAELATWKQRWGEVVIGDPILVEFKHVLNQVREGTDLTQDSVAIRDFVAFVREVLPADAVTALIASLAPNMFTGPVAPGMTYPQVPPYGYPAQTGALNPAQLADALRQLGIDISSNGGNGR